LAGALLCSVASLCGSALPAQSSTAAARITSIVDESSLATLRSNVPRLARSEFDQGEADGAMQMTHVRLVLQRSAAQQAALDQYLAELQDKSSPNYHQWLTPEQFGKLYGPADADIAKLVAWLGSHGLTIETVAKGRTNIAFSGTVSQIEGAFHTSIHSFQTDDRQFYSNITDPQIPSALTPVVMGVAQLNTIRPRPHLAHASAGKINPQTRRLEPAEAHLGNDAAPELTETGPDFLYIVPGDAATIYDTPNSFNANFSGTSYTGAGVKIGVGGEATITSSIVTQYRSRFLGSSYATAPVLNYCTTSASCSSTPSCTGGVGNCGYAASDSGPGGEAYIDMELAGGLAPGATIYYYASTDLYTGIEAAIEANSPLDIFSLSFGGCEADNESGSGDNTQVNSWWQQAAGQGIAVTVSTGDSGSAGCDNTQTKTGKNITEATGGLGVNGLASTPYNIAVGGTDFYALTSSAFTNYASTTNGTYYQSATKYIPESTWNDSTNPNGLISANLPWVSTSNCAEGANIVAGSGGVSEVYQRPLWQTGTSAVDSSGMRDLPDVSLMAGNGCYNATWAICDDETSSYNGQNITLNCETQSDGYWFLAGYGGTSTASPAFAGILAMVEQKTGSRLGQAAQTLYELYNGSYGSSCSGSNCIFHDVTEGNNSVPCTSGTGCGAYGSKASTSDFESGYNTLTGYDLATGMGSVDAANLVNYWGTAGGATASYSLSATTPASIAPGATTSSTITVNASNDYAGTVTLTCALTSPTNLTDPPTCSVGSTTVQLTATKTSGTTAVTVYTTPASSELIYPKLPGKGWTGAGGGALLALLVFVGIPARRRNWRQMLGVLVVMAALGSLAGCGSSSPSNTGNQGTSSGAYTFTVTGTGNPAVTPVPTITFIVTVN